VDLPPGTGSCGRPARKHFPWWRWTPLARGIGPLMKMKKIMSAIIEAAMNGTSSCDDEPLDEIIEFEREDGAGLMLSFRKDTA